MERCKHLLVILLACSLSSTGLAEYKMVCYYTNWAQYRNGAAKFMPPDIDPNLCTHIIYAFGKLDGNKITNFEWNDNDEWSNLYKQVNSHKETNPNLKTLLAMGGWTAGSLAYSNMAYNETNRREFINSAIDWLRKYNFDGLDMDWEYPANRDGKPYDKANFAHLCKETREAFDAEARSSGKERLLFTSAVGAGTGVIDTGYDVPAMAQYMDFICIMTYDLHGSWEAFTGLHAGLYASDADADKTLNVAHAANYWHSKGAPREKLIIGLATYGRSFTLVDGNNHGVGAPASGAGASGTYTRENGFLSYYEICEMQKSGQGQTYRDAKAEVPYYVNPSTKLWVGFDDETSIYRKLMDLIIKDKYGGAMTWALDLDDFTGTFCGKGRYPLISLMKRVLDEANGGATVAPPTTSKPVTAGPTSAPPTASPTQAPTNGPTAAPTNAPTTQAPSVTTTSGGGSGNGFCASASDGIHPHPEDCSKYYNCYAGIGDPLNCPSGQLFNPEKDYCDHPENVDCEGGTGAPPTDAATTAAPTPQATTAAPTQGPTTQGPITQAPAVSCEEGVRYLMHPTDCNKFYQCNHGEPVEKTCLEGLHFSLVHSNCVWPADSECGQ